MIDEIEYFNGAPAFTVGQFSDVLNLVLKASFDEGVWIEGEIEGLRRPNPHVYFSLIENILIFDLFAVILEKVFFRL
jgi:exonuclease VII large subunit